MNFAVIVAAGRGSRAGAGRAKQFREISGIPIIIHTLRQFERSETVGESVVVLPEDAREEFLGLAARHGLRKVARAVAGGETRAASVLRGLETLGGDGVVAVHDGVRPFVTPGEIDRAVREAEESGAAVLAIPASDTIKEELLRRAYAQPGALAAEVTDDSALVERLGAAVRVVEGGAHNFKLTTPRDFALAEVILKSSQ